MRVIVEAMPLMALAANFCGWSGGREDAPALDGFYGTIRTMAIDVTYWKAEEGGYIGFMNDYPDYATQGETLDELKRMLVSLRRDIEGEIVPGIRHQMTLEYA